MAQKKSKLIAGTLRLLILKAIGSDQCHGFEIQERIVRLSGNVFAAEEGSLYPSLLKMAKEGLIKGEWATSDRGRRARYYKITKKGQKQLKLEIKKWRVSSGAIERILAFK